MPDSEIKKPYALEVNAGELSYLQARAAHEIRLSLEREMMRPTGQVYVVYVVPRRVVVWSAIKNRIFRAWHFIRALRVHDSRCCYRDRGDW